jgi:hypothetical protein
MKTQSAIKFKCKWSHPRCVCIKQDEGYQSNTTILNIPFQLVYFNQATCFDPLKESSYKNVIYTTDVINLHPHIISWQHIGNSTTRHPTIKPFELQHPTLCDPATDFNNVYQSNILNTQFSYITPCCMLDCKRYQRDRSR